MRIFEIVYWNNHPAEGNGSDPHPGFPSDPFDSGLENLATAAFTSDGKVKRFWDLNLLARRPETAPPFDAEADVTPAGTSEPTMASVQAKPQETEPTMDRYRLVPFRR